MLARALALNPKVLLLDDFTARVDASTEKAILENLGESPNFQPKPDKNEKSFFDKVKEMFS